MHLMEEHKQFFNLGAGRSMPQQYDANIVASSSGNRGSNRDNVQ